MDVNGDGSSTMDDVYLMAATWLKHKADAGFDSDADLNHDGVVNNIDADILAGNWKIIQQNAARYYYHFDGLGSVVALSDKNGQTVETYQYSVFGDTAVYKYNADGSTTRLAASAVGNVYFFTARRLDTETGIYYYRARSYTPRLGRFLQTDPIGYADGINWYLYCGNNPIILIDPSGTLSFAGMLEGIYTGIENFENSVTGQLLSGYSEGALDGAAAWVDGAVPFADPLDHTYDASEMRFSKAMGGVSRNALVSAAGVGLMNAAGKTMQVGLRVKDGVHFYYGAKGTMLNALPMGGELYTVTQYHAMGYMATGSTWTIPTLSTSAVLATEGASATSCLTATLNAMFMSGAGELLIADGIFIFGEPMLEDYLSNRTKEGDK